MATKTQSIICRRMTALDKNQFSHQDSKYKFSGWATSRLDAEKGIVAYTDQQQLSVQNDAPPMELYAVWTERETLSSYENLKITSSNVAYDQTTAPIFYTVTLVKTYKGLSTPYAKITLANDVAEKSIEFNMNGTPGSETATSPRMQEVSYKHEASGLVATTQIVQGGYTPIYKINVKKTKYGEIKCTTGNEPLTIQTNGDIVTYASTNKNFTLLASPYVQSDHEWIAKSTCAYYSKDYNTRLKHAAAYPGSNKCGSWRTVTTKLYDFQHWSGGNVDGSTASQVVVQGSVANPPTVEAKFVRVPLLKNTVIGEWNPTWQIPTTTYETYTAYNTVYKWVPTCKTGLKYLAKYGISTMHEGVTGHGYYTAKKEPYTATRVKNTTYEYGTNKYYGASNVAAPYILYIPASGKLKIKGKYGTAVYGGKEKTQKGGFELKQCKNTSNVFDNFQPFNEKFEKSNDYAATLDIEFDVKKGERYQFTGILSKTAIWIDTIELTETE